MSSTAEISDDKGSHIWTLLPTFDPAVDNVREYIEKVKFIDTICPKKDRPMLAPRLAMLCRGTAWGQVKNLDSAQLVDPEHGVKNLLAALSTWEESTEMKTYEQFEKAVYKTVQKSDESSMSFVNRLQVAMDELGAKSIKEFHAFLLLRQSSLSPEDKKRVLTMTNGNMDTKKIEQAMRTLATSILSSGEVKRKVYPTNYVEPEQNLVTNEQEAFSAGSVNQYNSYEEEEIDQEFVDHLASQGDSDALNVVSFERDLEEMFQEVPDLHNALLSYQEARTKILERKRSRGFWPATGKGKSKGAGKFHQFRKGSGKGSLLQRISRTFCRACGEKGHWKAECPNKPPAATDQANFVTHQSFRSYARDDEPAHVIFEETDEAGNMSTMGNKKRGKGDKDNKWGICQVLSKACHSIRCFVSQCIRKQPITKNHTEHPKCESEIPHEVAFSLHHLVPQVKQFFRFRLNPRTKPSVPEHEASECFHSRPSLGAIAEDGLAILDTGASRSVIGADLWPGVMKSLPSEVQSRVQEHPSKVGFRFGNNQITYSFKQVRVPIIAGRTRIWMVVEIVPRATPFLISIQAMKALGAMIDLSTNQCYLSKIQRWLNLRESENGLYVFKMSELCLGVTENAMSAKETAAIRVSNVLPPPGLVRSESFQNVDSTGCHEADQVDGRGSDGIPQNALDHLDEPDRGESPRPGDHCATCDLPPISLGQRECPEGSDRGTLPDPQGKQIPKEDFKSRWAKSFGDWSPIGPFMGAGRGGGNQGCNKDSTKEEPAEISGSLNHEPPESQPDSGEQPRGSTCADCSGFGVMGQQESIMGENTQWETIHRGVRRTPKLRRLGQCTSQERDPGNARLHHLLPSSQRHGEAGTERPLERSANPGPSMHLENAYELHMMNQCRHHMPIQGHKPIDLLEVYASSSSRLTNEVNKRGGVAKRFTFEDGDLSTTEGQIKLFRKIFLWKPRHIWLAPECGPWSPWNRLNQTKSMESYSRIRESQAASKDQLYMCDLICKIQLDRGDHFHLENPKPSGMWQQEEMQEICGRTKPAFFDQCQFGLRHPSLQEPMQKSTRVQTSSEEMFRSLDNRLCSRDHAHAHVAGSCTVDGKTVQVSRFSAFYPRVLAKKIAEVIMRPVHEHVTVPTMVVQQECFPVRKLEDSGSPMESMAKRSRVKENETGKKSSRKRTHEEEPPKKIEDIRWKGVMDKYRKELPKSGVTKWDGPHNAEVQVLQSLCPEMQVQSVMACKGREKYMVHPDRLPHRRTVVLSRLSYEVFDLGTEDLQSMPNSHQKRKASMPSHVMVCVFGRQKESSEVQVVGDAIMEDPGTPPGTNHMPVPTSDSTRRVGEPNAENPEVSAPDLSSVMPANSWTSAAVSVSGPRFLQLSEPRKAYIRKLHHNLGHPTSERLSKHLAELGAEELLVQGALDYLCPSCVERRPPSLNPTGTLKEARDFNHRIYIDGFDWKSTTGYQGYVVHLIDEATQFHLGRRTVRDGIQAQKVFEECWSSWAGIPSELVMDCGGEFVAEPWKEFLQQGNITPILTAGPWQRGRIERHGAIVKEMLSRIDQAQPINNEGEFERALFQVFRAKNSLSTTCGYSPEQAVLGKATRLPASLTSDESTPAHMHAAFNEGPEAEKFRASLELRVLARKAFIDSDNSQAIRRATLRKSRGEINEWKCGQPCMFWDKRKSANMIEKGKWCGPAQVVLVESKTIVWITHINRLLRCARDNLRPVSLREFERHASFSQQIDAQQAQKLAENLQRRLHERSGMFQFSDLSDVPVEAPMEEDHPLGNQPEEEPSRRASHEPVPEARELRPEEVAIPESVDHEWSEPSDVSPSSFAPEPNGENNVTGSNFGENLSGNESIEDSNIVYNAFFSESNVPGPAIPSDEDTLWDDAQEDPRPYCEYEFDVPKQHVQRFIKDPKMNTSFLATAARRARSEVRYATLNASERDLFDKAKSKELNCWLETSAVRKIMRSKISPNRIMTSRWILTWKPDPSMPKGQKAKARLVVRGYQDPELDQVSTESPTLSRDARMLCLQVIASMGWVVQNFDITTAFLRGKSDGRQLAMEPVPELQRLLKMTSDEVLLLEGNAYGRVDAPLLFYKEFRRQLEKVGFEAHPLDNCLFLLRNKTNPEVLDGILGTHVDDGIGGGNHHYENALKELQKVLPFGQREFRKFRFTGLEIEQLPDNSIKISQEPYINKIEQIQVPKNRRANKNEMANAQEVQDLRGLCGSLQYAAVHSRPDIAAKVAFIQKNICKATVSTLLDANRVLIEAQQTADTAIMVRPLPLERITFASFGDASFASASQLKAQQGLFIVACTPELAANKTSEISPMSWNSKQIGRVVRSTLSAEAYAMSSSLDKLTWLRCLWGYILSPTFKWQYPERSLQACPKALLITDCKSLYDLVTKLAVPNCEEWRTTVEVMLIKQQAEGHSQCRWISTAIMLADCLTKPMESSFLRSVLRLGRFRIFDESQTLQNNSHRKIAAKWVSLPTAALEDEDPKVHPKEK